MSKQTHSEVMQEIESIKELALDALSSDCLGDMMVFMDKVKYPYFLVGTNNPDQTIQERERDTINDNDTIRNCFKHAILRELAGLWGMARATYEQETYNFERRYA